MTASPSKTMITPTALAWGLWPFFALLSVPAAAAEPPLAVPTKAMVSVWTDAKVSGETVFGKDIIASCHSSAAAQSSPADPCEQLKSLAIGPAPRLGQTKRLPLTQLRSLLGEQITVTSDAVALTISRPAKVIKRQQLVDAFERQLKKDVHPYSTERRVTLRSLTALGPITVEDAPITISFPALMEPLPDKSWFKSEVVIAQPSLQLVGSYPVAIHLSAKLRVVTLARTVGAGKALSKGDLKYDYIDQHRVTSRHFVQKSAAVGLKARSRQQRATVLVAYQWHNPSLIPNRKKVDVALKGKNFTIRTTGTTLEGGKKGDTIWLQVGKKAKKMQGTILNSQTVEVSL